MTTLQ